jgi:hypothetical protein
MLMANAAEKKVEKPVVKMVEKPVEKKAELDANVLAEVAKQKEFEDGVNNVINLNCMIFEKCYDGAITIVKSVFEKQMKDARPDATSLNYGGQDTPDLPIQAVIGVAGAIAPQIYKQVIDECYELYADAQEET